MSLSWSQSLSIMWERKSTKSMPPVNGTTTSEKSARLLSVEKQPDLLPFIGSLVSKHHWFAQLPLALRMELAAAVKLRLFTKSTTTDPGEQDSLVSLVGSSWPAKVQTVESRVVRSTRQLDTDQSLYFVLYGAVQLVADDTDVVATFNEGSHFGRELAPFAVTPAPPALRKRWSELCYRAQRTALLGVLEWENVRSMILHDSQLYYIFYDRYKFAQKSYIKLHQSELDWNPKVVRG